MSPKLGVQSYHTALLPAYCLPHLHLVWLPRGFLGPVSGPGRGPGVGQGLYAPLGWPVILEGGAGGEVALDLLQRHHRADLVGEQLVPDTLDLVMKTEISHRKQ